MPENIAAPRGFVDVWKYTTAIAVSLLIGLLSGQFIPNRNIVTTDQLNVSTKILYDGQISQQEQITALTATVNELTGELRAQRLITQKSP